MLALLSVWIALGALLTAILAACFRWNDRELVVTLLPYTLALSATLAAAVLWGLRHRPAGDRGVDGRRVQAVAALVLNSLSFAVLLVWLDGLVNALLGLCLEFGFLAVIYWLYTRVLVPQERPP